MYKDPNTSDLILTHPLELTRIPGFRDHGFDELNPIQTWLIGQMEVHKWDSFHATYGDGSKYIFIQCKSDLSDAIPNYKIEIEVGYIDFQDQEKKPMAGANIILYQNSKLLSLVSVTNEGIPSEDVYTALTEITDGPYLKLKPEQ